MLQRSTIPSVTTTAADLTETWQGRLRDDWLQSLRQVIQLPTSLRAFVVYVIGLSLLCGALIVQVLLSVQIIQAQAELRDLRAALDQVEQDKAEVIRQISQATTLDGVYARALQIGYVDAPERTYVPQSTLTQDIPWLRSAAQDAAPATMTPDGDAARAPASASPDEGEQEGWAVRVGDRLSGWTDRLRAWGSQTWDWTLGRLTGRDSPALQAPQP